MLKVRDIFGIILLMATSCAVLAQSHQHPKAKIENSKLGANNSHAHPAPAPTYPTIQEITEAIANGIERAANKHETETHAPPPNDSNWWFSLALVGFTGLLVIVGIANCYLIFWTLKATTIAAVAAQQSANLAEQAMYGTEAPFLFIIISSTDGNAIGTAASPQGVEYPEHVSYMFHNYGRSPAIIREIYIACIANEVMPGPCPFPPLQTNLFQTEIVGTNSSSQPKSLPQIASYLPNNGRSHQLASVFACGNVRYADVFGNQYISGFCYAFNDRSNRFYAIGGANHNYRRKLTEDENRKAEERDILPSLNKE